MDFKKWLEGWEIDKGAKIPPQSGPDYTFYTHPDDPDILWEPARKKIMDAGEEVQWIRMYRYNKKYNKLTKIGDDLLYWDYVDRNKIKPVELSRPVIAY